MAEPQTDLGAGTILYISTAEPATYDEAGFGALTWIEVVDVVNIGGGGGSASVVEYTPLKTGKAVRKAGPITYDDRAVQAGKHRNNAGHQTLKSYFDGANQGKILSFRVGYVDGSNDYFTGTISGFTNDTLEAGTFMFDTITFTPNNPGVFSSGTDTFTLTYAAGANGTLIGVAVQSVEEGASGSAVFAAADAGYVFSSWSDASTDNPRTDTNVTADVTVTASFVPE